ncbi:MAG: alpha/beta hydrolase [Solirubrobacteraceae bacterium]|jgi:pimeloyl-ACP methyl ester carboxylesterase
MTITQSEHTTATATSGDVDLFYRRFGEPGLTPILILHGANYYDSYDWIEVAAALASDREVVAFDARGYGASTWSPSGDYSIDAQIADIGAVCDQLGWPLPILLGASRGGSFALRFAARFPERASAVVLVDHCPGRTAAGQVGAARQQGLAKRSPGVFPTLADALAATTRDPSSLARPASRARLEMFLADVEGGYVIATRDPAFQNDRPNGRPDWVSAFPPTDPWQELAELRVPTLAVRATRSRAFDAEALRRLRDEFPGVTVAEIDSGHDVAGTAPAALVSCVQRFLETAFNHH